MNIFVLDYDPVQAAQDQCDKHVVKMVLETAQMLSTVQNAFGMETRYKPTHGKHPCTLWAMQTAANYDWLVKHGQALSAEYTKRYRKVHACHDMLHNELARNPLGDFRHDIYTEFAQAMPEQYRARSAVVAYRRYYLGEKSGFATWTNSIPPVWFQLSDPFHNLRQDVVQEVTTLS